MSESKNYIKNLIASGRTETAISKLQSDFLQNNEELDNLNNMLLLLSARYNQMKKNELLGIIGETDKQREYAKINYSLLEIIDQIPEVPTVSIEFILKNILNLISADKITDAINELMVILKSENKNQYNQAVLLSGIYSNCKKDLDFGSLPHDVSEKINSETNDKLISIVEDKLQNIKSFSNTGNLIYELLIKFETIIQQLQEKIKNEEEKIKNNSQQNVQKNKYLFLYSNPGNSNPLPQGKEVALIMNILKNAKNRIDFELLPSIPEVRYDELMKNIKLSQPEILHISTHGSKSEGLIFQDNNSKIKYMNLLQLDMTFKLAVQNYKNKMINCVLFSACHSFGFAEMLVKNGYTKYAIGMSDKIHGDAVLAFEKGFYDGLFNGNDIKSSFELGKYMISIENIKVENEEEIKWEEIPQLYSFEN